MLSCSVLLVAAALGRIDQVPVFSGSLGLDAGAAKWYTIPVPSGFESATMEGRFTASGGTGNDVEVFVLDEDGLTNWRNGHGVATYYNSDQVTTATVSARLQPGRTFYLVFSNRFSVFATKTVAGDIHLTLYRPDPLPLLGTGSGAAGDQAAKGSNGEFELLVGTVAVASVGLVLGLIVVALVRAARRERPAAASLDLSGGPSPGAGFCPGCGRKAIAGAGFCHGCGSKLPAAATPD